ncbi:hypothetical protein CVT26_004980 [Gymnopilus dilepis]|uniref:Uncharacterized protein n=1 Tax=Gymnopilus dilepis TaxID=231916 RepID=A0A409Y026_9AGAR|nr:hypothetical protein CVT26_004980 [Gymnopilus dilepis]
MSPSKDESASSTPLSPAFLRSDGLSPNSGSLEFSASPLCTYSFGADPVETVQLDAVLSAFIEKIYDCGGWQGALNVSTAIIICAGVGTSTTGVEDVDQFEALRGFGVTLLTHFLFPFAVSRGRLNEPPIRSMIKDKVLRRDGFECCITGVVDRSHPQPPKGVFADFDIDEESDSVGFFHVLVGGINSKANHFVHQYKSIVVTLRGLAQAICASSDQVDT